MWKELRRIVTGHNAQGRSIVTIDGPPGNSAGGEGRGLRELWNTRGGPIDTRSADDPTRGEVRLSPPPGGTKFRYFILPPEDPDTPREEIEKGVAARFAAYGESHARVDTTRHPAMHKTHSLDYIILLSGEVTLLLDEDEVPVRPFDVVVQRGTNHAWVNTGREPALFAGVLIDADIED